MNYNSETILLEQSIPELSRLRDLSEGDTSFLWIYHFPVALSNFTTNKYVKFNCYDLF